MTIENPSLWRERLIGLVLGAVLGILGTVAWVHLQEKEALSPPIRPGFGELWFNESDQQMYVYRGWQKEAIVQGPEGGGGHSFYETMQLDQLESQLNSPAGDSDRNYTIVGLEVEGQLWWWSDGRWLGVDPPPKEKGSLESCLDYFEAFNDAYADVIRFCEGERP